MYVLCVLILQGFVSDREYNTFQSKGYTWPLSIFQLRSNARNKYSRKGTETLKAMFTPVGIHNNFTYQALYLIDFFCFCCFGIVTSDGKIEAELNNPVVPTSVLEDIWRWKQAGATFEDVLRRLRLKCVPPNVVPKPWMPGECSALS